MHLNYAEVIENNFLDGSYFRVLGKLAKWNGHPAQVRYICEIGGSVKITSKSELHSDYEKQLALRRQYSADALAIANYNLTDGTVYNWSIKTIQSQGAVQRTNTKMSFAFWKPMFTRRLKRVSLIPSASAIRSSSYIFKEKLI